MRTRFYLSEDGESVIIVVPKDQITAGPLREQIAHRIGPREEAVNVNSQELEAWVAANLPHVE